MYKVDGAGWFINDDFGQKAGRLWNDSMTNTLPCEGWKVFDSVKGYVDDPPNPNEVEELESKCDKITITVRGEAAKDFPEIQGAYKKNNMFWQGWPIFENSKGNYLFVDDKDYWALGSELGGRRKLIGKFTSNKDSKIKLE